MLTSDVPLALTYDDVLLVPRHSTVLPSDVSFEWTAMSYQENVTGNTLVYVFALSLLLVYLCLAGQYESWILPLSVLAAVPLALVGPVLALSAVGAANNLYVQIGLMLLIALSAKNGILIVEVAREERLIHGKPILEAAVEASRMRLRQILMTPFAFILGVLPLVLATGGGLVTAADTYALLRRSTLTIWLKASPEEHWNRVVGQGECRGQEVVRAGALVEPADQVGDRRVRVRPAHDGGVEQQPSGLPADCLRLCRRHP